MHSERITVLIVTVIFSALRRFNEEEGTAADFEDDDEDEDEPSGQYF